MLLQQQSEEKGLDLEQLRKQLESKKPEESIAAESHLQQLSPSDLIELIGMESRARQRRRRTAIYVLLGYALFLLICLFFGRHIGQFWMFGNMVGVFASAAAFKPGHKRAAQQLAKYDDVTAVGALVESLEIKDSEVQHSVFSALARLLPRLHATDAHLLNKEQRRILLKHLSSSLPPNNWDAALSAYLAAVKVLEQIGDESFVPLVEALSEGRHAGIVPSIQEAARQCLPYLKQRVENERASHQLLRASAPDHSHDADVLLRPAVGRGETRPDELLRPGSVLHDEQSLIDA